MLLAAFVLTLALQDDVSHLLEQLRGDDSTAREAAQRSLERMGLPILDRLTAELEKESELETRIRLKTLVQRIPKLAQLAKVYGPTRRITCSAKGTPLADVLAKVGQALGENLRADGVDLSMPVTLDLAEATLWEALDRLAKATGTHPVYGQNGVVFKAGAAPDFPVQYYEQFRISLVEVKRVDYRGPGEKGSALVVMPEVRYQRNLSPAGDKYRKVFVLDSIEGAAGGDARATPPAWLKQTATAPREFALEEPCYVDPAVRKFTVTGKAVVNFSQAYRELTFPLTGEAREETTADGTFRLAEKRAEADHLVLKLDIEVPEAGGMDDRFRGVWVVDGDGKRHAATIVTMGRDGKKFRPALWSDVGQDKAKTLVFRWMTGMHQVEIPFALRDIRVP